MTAMNFRLLSYLKFKSVENWRFNDSEKFNNYFKINTVLFGKIIDKSPIVREKIIDENQYSIIGVRSYGKGAYINRVVKGEDLTMKLYQVVPKNHLIWCKVDTKNGAFGIVLDSFEGSYASSNMSLAKINLDEVNLEYLQILFRIPKFNEYMDNSVTGSTNRKYLTFDQILNDVQVPLPDLASQNQLVNQYNKNLAKAKKAENQANELEKSIESYLLEELGINAPKPVERKQGLQFIRLKEMNSWSIDKILYDGENDFDQFQKLSNKINVENAFRGKSPKYEDDGEVTILNQKCNRWNEIKLEFAKRVNKNWFDSIDDKFKTVENDVLINSTGDGTIGRSSLVTKGFEGLIYDSHILLVRLNQNLINPAFFVYQFNSAFIQSQIEQIKSAQSTKQTELGLDNLFKLNFKFPSLEIQTQIVNHITTQKEQIKSLRQQAEKLRKQAKENFEKEIFV